MTVCGIKCHRWVAEVDTLTDEIADLKDIINSPKRIQKIMAEELNMNVTTCALNGGEDYELLFTVPLTDHDKVAAMKGVKVIGHITKSELGCGLITRDGQEFELKAQGWNPLNEK